MGTWTENLPFSLTEDTFIYTYINYIYKLIYSKKEVPVPEKLICYFVGHVGVSNEKICTDLFKVFTWKSGQFSIQMAFDVLTKQYEPLNKLVYIVLNWF